MNRSQRSFPSPISLFSFEISHLPFGISHLPFGILFFLVFRFSSPALSQVHYDTLSRKTVGPGVVHMKMAAPSIPWRVEVLEVDLTNPWITFETVKSRDLLNGGLERTTSMSARRDAPGHYVVGAVNADFFSFETSQPNSMQVIEGEVLRRERTDYPGFAITPEKQVAFRKPVLSGSLIANGSTRTLSGVNETRDAHELVLFNSLFAAATGTDVNGTEVRIIPIGGWRVNDTLRCIVDTVVAGVGNLVIAKGKGVLSGNGNAATFLSSNVQQGDTISLFIQVLSGFPPLKELISGHPFLVQNGVKSTLSSSDGLVTTRNPRTLIGVNADTTKLVLIVVDGRQSGYSAGMTLWECQDFCKDVLNLYQAMNFDGGGSSTMVVRGVVENSPSDPGGERSVANSLQVISLAPAGPLSSLNIIESTANIFQGGSFRFHAEGKDEYYNPLTLPPDVVWSCDSAIGTIDSTGLFSAFNVNASGWVRVEYGPASDSAFVVVRMLTSLRAYPSTLVMVPGERLTLSVRGEDSQGSKAVLTNTQAAFQSNTASLYVDQAGLVTSTGFGSGALTVGIDTLRSVLPYNSSGHDTTIVVDVFNDTFLWSWDLVNADADNFTFGVLTDTTIVSSPAFRFTYDFLPAAASVFLNTDLPLSGRVDSVYLRVLGDGGGHVFRLFFKDKDGELFVITAPGTVNWTNSWKTVNFRMVYATPVGSGTVDYPITLTQIQIVLGQTNLSGGHVVGHVTIDDLTAHYPNRAVTPQVLFDFNSGVKVTGWLQPFGVGSGQTVGITTSSNLAWSTDHPYEGDGVGKWTFIDDAALSTDWSIRIARSGPSTELGLMLRGSFIGAWVWGEGDMGLTLRTVIRDGNSQICQGPPFPVKHFGWKLIGTKLDASLFTPWLTAGTITDVNNKFNGFRVQGSNSILSGQTRILYIDKMVTSALTVPTGFITFSVTRNGPNVQLFWSVNSEISISRYVIERGVGGVFAEIGAVDGAGNTDTTKHYEFVDLPANGQVYQYRVRQWTNDGGQEVTPTQVVDMTTGVEEGEVPLEFGLEQNYPNPFNPMTIVDFRLSFGGAARLSVVDLLGREVAIVFDHYKPAGKHSVTIDASRLASGVYFYRLVAGTNIAVRKMVVVR